MNPQLGICIHGVGAEYIKKNNFKTVQLCDRFSEAGDITSVLKLSKSHDIKISYHAPVFHQSDPTVTYYLNSNFRLREATFEILEINLKMAKALPTQYVVIHFAGSGAEEEITDSEMKYQAKRSAKRIGMLSDQYDIPINIEYTNHNTRFDKPDDFIDVVKDYPNIGLCIDLAHLYTTCHLYGLDYFIELEKLLPYTKAINVWTTNSKQAMEMYGYIPVHPSQTTDEGWIDIEKTINLALSHNEDMYIIFEPNFTYNGEEYFEEGVSWVNDIVNQFKLNLESEKALTLAEG